MTPDVDAAILAAAESVAYSWWVTGRMSGEHVKQLMVDCAISHIREHVGPVIEALQRDNAHLRGAMKAQDERERAAGERCGVPYEMHGCDWPDWAAEEVLTLQARVRELDAEIALMRQRRDEYIAASNRDLEARRAAEAEAVSARERTARMCVEITEGIGSDAGDRIGAAILREFGIDAARKGGAA